MSKVPPHAEEAEKSTLGSLLIDKDAIIKVADLLKPEDFYSSANETIYKAILELYDKRMAIDILTITSNLEDQGKLSEIGGSSYLTTLANEVPTSTHVFQYALIVKQKATLRRLIKAGQDITALGYDESEDINSQLEKAEKSLFSVSQTFFKDKFIHIRDILTSTYEKIADLHDPDNKDKYSGMPTGFKSLDNVISGLHPSDLVILAARPSMGKTALALNIAHNISKRGKSVGIISLEMSKEQLVERLFCSMLEVDSWKIKTGKLSESDFARIGPVMDELNSLKIFIDDSLGNSIVELRAKTRRLQMQHGLDLLIIDYLQLMQSGSGSSSYGVNRVQEISEISRAIKMMAREMHIPIIALSQLSRAVENRPSKVPQLSDLRECVPGDTLVCLPNGERKQVKDLQGGVPDVISVDRKGKLTSKKAEQVWCVGMRPVYKIKLASGREIEATEGHKLKTLEGWKEVKDLNKKDRVGISRRLPEPINPIKWSNQKVALLGQLIGDGSYLKGQPLRYTTSSEENSEIVRKAAEEEFNATVKRYKGIGNWHQLLISGNGNRWHPKGVNKWLKDLGIFNQKSHKKCIPEEAFKLSNKQTAILLRHLWAADGTIYTRKSGLRGSNVIQYSTNSAQLAKDINFLLLRFEICARIKKTRKKGYKAGYIISIGDSKSQKVFLDKIGAFGPRKKQAEELKKILKTQISNTNVDLIPRKIFGHIKNLMKAKGISHRQMAALRGTSYGGSAHFSFAPSRTVLNDYAKILKNSELKEIAESDLFWDKIASITPAGKKEVYDISVPYTESWLADGIVCHNSGAIEQDADIVMMMYREDYYEEDTTRKGITDLFIKKHRNGPTGHVELRFQKERMRFYDIDRKHRPPSSRGREGAAAPTKDISSPVF